MRAVETFAEYLSACFGADVPLIEIEHGTDLAGATRAARSHPAAVLSAAVRGDAALAEPDAWRAALEAAGARVEFVGWAPGQTALLALLGPPDLLARAPAPATFRVTALMPTYNEADVLEGTLRALIADGIDVYVLDNWSTDATPEIARHYLGRGVRALERFPPDGPSATYDLRAILSRLEQVAADSDADWLVLHDADERRRPPWPGVTLRDALWHVQQRGFTCVDHVTLNFAPVDNGYRPDVDLEAYFACFAFSDHPGHFHQRRAWRHPRAPIALAPTAGHDVQFGGRRVFPYKFLLKHYPIRSQAHGERKVRVERQRRWNAAERALGWHAQYDDLACRSFLGDPRCLERFDASFPERRLVERLSGVGVFAAPPAWATPPHWASAAGAGSRAGRS